MSKILNQLIAVEKGLKARVYADTTKLYQLIQKPELQQGLTKTYKAIAEEGEKLPPQNHKVQIIARDVLQQIAAATIPYFDAVASKDLTNTLARADVEVEGQKLLEGVPVSTLLFLEKQILDYRTVVEKTPTLDNSEDWTLDEQQGFYKTEASESTRTTKIPKVIVRAEATKEHPAQTELLTIDEVSGYWTTVKQSGSLTVPEKAKLLRRANALLDAIKSARELANTTNAIQEDIGKALFTYLLG